MHIRFHTGGPAVHPTRTQAGQIAQWLGPAYTCSIVDDAAAFADLETVDALVLMGLFWPGMDADWAGNLVYDPLPPAALAQFLAYRSARRPLLIHHGAIGCYSDLPAFTAALGVSWGVRRATHSPVLPHALRVDPTPHPLTTGIGDFTVTDELYHSLVYDPAVPRTDVLWGDWEGCTYPLVSAFGATPTRGRTVFNALGHGHEAFQAPAMQRLWVNSIRWALQSDGV